MILSPAKEGKPTFMMPRRSGVVIGGWLLRQRSQAPKQAARTVCSYPVRNCTTAGQHAVIILNMIDCEWVGKMRAARFAVVATLHLVVSGNKAFVKPHVRR